TNTNFNFTVSLSSPSSSTITVTYQTQDGTATAGSDYTTATGTLTFAPGQTSKTVAVQVLGDTVFEPNETFKVVLTGTTGGALLGTDTGTGTIVNDDAAPLAINITPSVSQNEGGAYVAMPYVFTVTLSKANASPITVVYSTADGTATAG